MSIEELALLMAKKEHELQYLRSPKGMISTWEELNESKQKWWINAMLPYAEVAFNYLKVGII